MHHLITAVASFMILGLFLSQFVANENLFIETLAIERTINEYADREYGEDELEDRLKELKARLDDIPNVKAEIREDRISVRIGDVIGPSEAVGIGDDSILIEKDLKLRIREEKDEEFDNNGGDTGADDTSEQISDGDEPDSAG